MEIPTVQLPVALIKYVVTISDGSHNRSRIIWSNIQVRCLIDEFNNFIKYKQPAD